MAAPPPDGSGPPPYAWCAIDVFFQPGGDKVAHPETRLTLPEGWKILGGGAKVNYSGVGSMLTASYPEAPRTWIAKAKDHHTPDPSNIDVWAIGIYDPEDNWDMQIFNAVSTPSIRPYGTASVGEGYVLTGGGAWVDYESHNGYGNILTASYPEPSQASWTAASKAPNDNDQCTLYIYAIGLRHKAGAIHLRTKISDHEGGVTSHPHSEVAVEAGYTLVGGGARVQKYKQGSYLTASYPDFLTGTWIVESKDHIVGDPTSIIAYAIGLRE